MLNKAPFEIITAEGLRFRFKEPNYIWQYGLVEGTIDTSDRVVVEVLSIDSEDETEIVAIFNQVIMVGNVTNETFITMPREKRLIKCSHCGFTEPLS